MNGPPGGIQLPAELVEGLTQEQIQQIAALPLPPAFEQAITAARGAFFAEVGQAWEHSIAPFTLLLKFSSVRAELIVKQMQERIQRAEAAQTASTAEQVRQIEAERRAKKAAKQTAAAGAAEGTPAGKNRAQRRAAKRK